MKTREIIAFARDVRKNWGADPYAVAEKLGVRIVYTPSRVTDACVVRAEKYPVIICIRGTYNEAGRTVLCAHELGHALLHDEGVNRFSGTSEAISDKREYEANLFAVAFLFNDDDFNIPIASMSNYTLKGILDYNLRGG